MIFIQKFASSKTDLIVFKCMCGIVVKTTIIVYNLFFKNITYGRAYYLNSLPFTSKKYFLN